MAAHPSILAWEIPWTEEYGGLLHCKESDMTEHITTTTTLAIKTPPLYIKCLL